MNNDICYVCKKPMGNSLHQADLITSEQFPKRVIRKIRVHCHCKCEHLLNDAFSEESEVKE